MRALITCSFCVKALALSSMGCINSSNNIAPGCTAGIRFYPDGIFINLYHIPDVLRLLYQIFNDISNFAICESLS